MTPRFALKAGTDDLHQELDNRLSRLDLAEADDYRRFLRFHGRTVPPVEESLVAGGLEELLPGWSSWRRTCAIMADLAAFSEPAPPPALAPKNNSKAELLGTAYVLKDRASGGASFGKGLAIHCLSAFSLRLAAKTRGSHLLPFWIAISVRSRSWTKPSRPPGAASNCS